MNENRKYESYKIPTHKLKQENEAVQTSSRTEANFSNFHETVNFTEIEIEDRSENDSGKCIPKSQVIEPDMDEKRIIFNEMRQIARENQAPFIILSKFYDQNVQYHSAKIFYKQAVFMKDFEDDFTEEVPFSSYYPYYQLMSYDQLRTYFTWRTNVRSGNITNTSLSYAFVYIYELLNNIGVEDPQDGLDKLMYFWNAFQVYSSALDKYVIMWIKDYHIYYELPKSFKDFASDNHMLMHYPKIFHSESDSKDTFQSLCSISKYDISKSAFYNDETCKLINDCFCYVIKRLKQLLKSVDIHFDDLIFYPTNQSVWTPFKRALFFSSIRQRDRRVVLSEKEIYSCKQNKWSFSTVITVESGKKLIGYLMKQMESVLRRVTHYKYKLSANTYKLSNEAIRKLEDAGIYLEKIVNDSVLEFYSELNRMVVSVNETSLNKIRKEALGTQEKLVVSEDDTQIAASTSFDAPQVIVLKETSPLRLPNEEVKSLSDGWTSLKNALNTTETKALAILLQEGNIKQFANENDMMLEVLVDSINEKAIDHIGDYILELDDGMTIFDEYKEKILKMVGR